MIHTSMTAIGLLFHRYVTTNKFKNHLASHLSSVSANNLVKGKTVAQLTIRIRQRATFSSGSPDEAGHRELDFLLDKICFKNTCFASKYLPFHQ